MQRGFELNINPFFYFQRSNLTTPWPSRTDHPPGPLLTWKQTAIPLTRVYLQGNTQKSEGQKGIAENNRQSLLM